MCLGFLSTCFVGARKQLQQVDGIAGQTKALEQRLVSIEQQQQRQHEPISNTSSALIKKFQEELEGVKQQVVVLQQKDLEQVKQQMKDLQQRQQQQQQQQQPAPSPELSQALQEVQKKVLELQQLKQQVEGLQQQPKPALSSELSTATEQVNKQVLELQQLKQKVEKVQQQLQQKHQQQPTQGAEPSEVLQKVQRQVLELQHQQQQQRQHLSDGRPPAAAVAGALPDSEPQLAQRVKAAEGTVAKLRGLVENKTTDGMVPRGEMMRALEAVTSSVLGRLKKVACHDVVCVHAAVGVAHMDSKAQEISLFVCFPVVEM